MYELLIKKNTEWFTVDFGDDKPAMNFQANDIAELKDRQANYSMTLKLPTTPNNIRIFEFPTDVDSGSAFPYRNHECRLYSNGYELAGKGSMLILERVTDSIEVQIVGGNASFFEALASSKVADLDLGYYIRGEVGNDPRHAYAIATFTKGGASTLPSWEYFIPFVKVESILQAIGDYSGFSISNNISASIADKALSLVSLNATDFDNFQNTEVSAANQVTMYGNKPASYMPWVVETDPNGWFTVVGTDISSEFRGINYTCQTTGLLNIVMIVNGVSVYGDLPYDVMVQSVENMNTGEVITQNGYNFYSLVANMNVTIGDVIQISFYKIEESYFHDTIYEWDYRVDVRIINGDIVPRGGKVNIAPNIGFDTQLDLFKAIVQLFGMTTIVDNDNNSVRAFTLDYLYSNKNTSNTLDWSEKLHGVKTLSFASSVYAQQNRILLEKNGDDNVQDIGVFINENESLASTKDLFTIAIESGLDNNMFDLSLTNTSKTLKVANIPFFEVDIQPAFITATFKGVSKSHFVQILDDVQLNTFDGLFPYARHFTMQQCIDTYYDKLVNNMLVRDKYLEATFWLTDLEIEQIDQFKPIYLNQYGAYFYLNKVKNYISKQLTTVELIRM